MRMPDMRFAYPQPAVRDFDAEEKEIRETIAQYERLAKSIWRILPCFVTQAAIDRMGLETVATLLEEFHGALRGHFCEGNEDELVRLAEQRARPVPMWKPPKPTVEELMSAQKSVSQLEDAMAGLEGLEAKENYAYGSMVALMRPLIEMQLDSARNHLTYIQTRMEEPDDEATETTVSSEQALSEGTVPDEAE